MDFQTTVNINNEVAEIHLIGELTTNTVSLFQSAVEQVAQANIQQLVLQMGALTYMSSAGLRVLIFAKQKMGSQVDIYVVSPSEMIVETLKKTGLHHSIILVD